MSEIVNLAEQPRPFFPFTTAISLPRITFKAGCFVRVLTSRPPEEDQTYHGCILLQCHNE